MTRAFRNLMLPMAVLLAAAAAAPAKAQSDAASEGDASSQAAEDSSDAGFEPMLKGDSLEGWVQHGGKAKYEVKDGVVIGTSVPNTPNSFLCTAKEYGDFELRLEFKVDDLLNSGIQIRSEVYEERTKVTIQTADGEKTFTFPADRVHGYQVEIDPSDRAWSAGIYDEARRGWLYPLDGDEHKDAREAFRHNEWNKLRVVAKGSSIRTWLNGVPAANLVDDATPRGLIALQVHGVGSPEQVGKQVMWRNIQLKELEE